MPESNIDHSALQDLKTALAKVFRCDVSETVPFGALWRSALVVCVNHEDPTLLTYIASLEQRVINLREEARKDHETAAKNARDQGKAAHATVCNLREHIDMLRSQREAVTEVTNKQISDLLQEREQLGDVAEQWMEESGRLRAQLTEAEGNGFSLASDYKQFRHETARAICESLRDHDLPSMELLMVLRTIVYECTEHTMRYTVYGENGTERATVVIQDHLWGALGNPESDAGEQDIKRGVADKPMPWPGSEYLDDPTEVPEPEVVAEPSLEHDTQVRPLSPEDDFDPHDPRWTQYAADPTLNRGIEPDKAGNIYEPAPVDPESRPEVTSRLDCECTPRESDPSMPWVQRVARPKAHDEQGDHERQQANCEYGEARQGVKDLDPWQASSPNEPPAMPKSLTDLTGMDPTSNTHEHTDEVPKK